MDLLANRTKIMIDYNRIDDNDCDSSIGYGKLIKALSKSLKNLKGLKKM